MFEERRVVVTGIGPIASSGIGREQFWQGLLNKKLNIKLEEKSIDNEIWDKYHVYRVEDFNIDNFGLDKNLLGWIDDWKQGDKVNDLYFMLAAVKLALDDSGIEYNPDRENELGLVITHENFNLIPFLSKISETSYQLLHGKSNNMTKKEFFEKLYLDCVRSGYDTQPFMALFHVAKVFNVHNNSLFVCNACASGLYAIETASQMIKNKQNSVVAIASSDYPEIYKQKWFSDLGIYSKDGMIRPFSTDNNGFVLGECGIAIILEDLNHAVARNAPIYAEYKGGGFSLESWQVTIPQVGSTSYQNAIKKAFEQSGTSKDNIDLLVPHGVGSHVTDYYESKAITDIFGRNPLRPNITAFKPYIGHTLGASALIETAIMLLCIKNDTIIPTLNCKKPKLEYGIAPLSGLKKIKINTALKICSAFAGYNAAAIFSRIN